MRFLTMDFYNLLPADDWTCISIMEHYHSKMQKLDTKTILDCIKKDLEIVAVADSGFNMTSRKKAQEILDSWKVMFLVCSNSSHMSAQSIEMW